MKQNEGRARQQGWLEPTPNFPYSLPMETTPAPTRQNPWDRWIAVAMLGLAALLAAGWIMRERQVAIDRAESREDLRQAMHRLKTLSSSTDQIRTAYLQRKSELELTRKKLEQATSRSPEDKTKSRSSPEDKAKSAKSVATISEKLAGAKLPEWAAVETTEGAVRILPGVSLPSGNTGFQSFASIASTLAALDPDWVLELTARAEPGSDAWETAQERGDLLIRAAEKSLKGQPGRLRLRIEVAKGPRMEWRLQISEPPAKPSPPAKTNPELKADKK